MEIGGEEAGHVINHRVWFTTALFWRPQVALLINTRTFVPVFMELAPAATLLDRAPAAIDELLLRHGVEDASSPQSESRWPRSASLRPTIAA